MNEQVGNREMPISVVSWIPFFLSPLPPSFPTSVFRVLISQKLLMAFIYPPTWSKNLKQLVYGHAHQREDIHVGVIHFSFNDLTTVYGLRFKRMTIITYYGILLNYRKNCFINIEICSSLRMPWFSILGHTLNTIIWWLIYFFKTFCSLVFWWKFILGKITELVQKEDVT